MTAMAKGEIRTKTNASGDGIEHWVSAQRLDQRGARFLLTRRCLGAWLRRSFSQRTTFTQAWIYPIGHNL
jgi:hypothetical protein